MEVMDTCCHRNYILASNGIVIWERLAYQKGFIKHMLLLLINNMGSNKITSILTV